MLFVIAAVLTFWAGGRALHEFGQIDRVLGEMVGLVLAGVLGLVAVLLRGFAQRIEDHDDGEPVSLEISEPSENVKQK